MANDLEKGIAEIVDAHKSTFEAYALRPATFASADGPQQRRTSSSRKLVSGLGHGPMASIEPSRVGKAMVKVACDGWKETAIENDVILKLSN